MRLLHYSDRPLSTVLARSQVQDRPLPFVKPNGLWVSVEGEDDWLSCGSETCTLGRLTHVHLIELAVDAKVLRLTDAAGIDAFTARFGEGSGLDAGMDWASVAAEFQGLIIAPFVWSRRMHPETLWYYFWDCASGCIWDPAAIQSVILLEAEGFAPP